MVVLPEGIGHNPAGLLSPDARTPTLVNLDTCGESRLGVSGIWVQPVERRFPAAVVVVVKLMSVEFIAA